MPRVTGPTVPRWQLGAELERLRREAGVTHNEVAGILECSESKARKIENGYVGVVKTELSALLDLYGVADPERRDELFELQKLGKQRGWWSKYGTLPWSYATFLGLESGAISVKTYEAFVVPGLLQTEDYARAVTKGATPNLGHENLERQVRIRMTRQEMTLGEDSPKLWAILDESVLRRRIGGSMVMKDQLKHLIAASEWCTIQVIPHRYGGHPGTLGPFTILEFDEAIHSPVVYVEGQAGSLYLEKEPDLIRCNLAYDHMTAAALSPPDSRTLIAEAAEEMDES